MNLSSDLQVTGQDFIAPTDHLDPSSSVELKNTLSRLVRLGRITWAPTDTDTTFAELYSQWLADAFISKKIDNFRMFKAKPKLTFVVNGFSWYYGKLVLAVDIDPGTDYSDVDVSTKFIVKDGPGCLQIPHVSIDPSLSQTYQLHFPFYSASGWYDRYEVFRPTARLRVIPFNPLASANDVAPTSVSIEVYISMEDIELTVPGYVSESSEIKLDGLVSAPLSATADSLNKINAIGQALAPGSTSFITPITGMMSKAAAALKQLGFSSPGMFDYQASYDIPNTLTASHNARDASVPLRDDMKGYLAIDSVASGVPTSEDDQTVLGICRRWGFVNTVTWNPAGLNQLLEYHPLSSALLTGTVWRFTPLAHMSSLHAYWSGSLEIKFEVVSSQFHRGAFGIVIFPNPVNTPPAGFDPDESPNLYKTTIVDISKTKEVTVTLPFYSNAQSLQMPVIPNDAPTGLYSDTKKFPPSMYIYDVTPLASSGSTSPVYINCYIRAGPDFKLYKIVPPSQKRFYVVAESESGVEIYPERSAIKADSSVVSDNDNRMSLVVFGEHTVSIKQITSKPQLMTILDNNSTHITDYIAYSLPTKVPTFQNGGYNAGPCAIAVLQAGFLARRGGLRYKMVFVEQTAPPHTVLDPTSTVMFVQIQKSSGNFPLPFVEVPLNTSSIDFPAARVYRRHWDSSAFEFVVPSLTRSRFYSGRASYRTGADATDPNALLPVFYNLTFDDAGPGRCHVFISGDEDFTLHGYYCAPKAAFVVA
jgi:hypothetical protein